MLSSYFLAIYYISENNILEAIMKDDIIIPRSFAERVLLTSKLSTLSIQIAFYLVDEIGFGIYKKLPKRMDIARKFKASSVGVNNCLTQLFDNEIILSDDIIYNGSNKKFSGNFRLNDDIDIDAYLKTHTMDEAIHNSNIPNEKLIEYIKNIGGIKNDYK